MRYSCLLVTRQRIALLSATRWRHSPNESGRTSRSLDSTSCPAAAWTSRSATTRSSGGMMTEPFTPLRSRIQRARRRAVRLFASPNAWARATRNIRMAAASTHSSTSSIDVNARRSRSRSSGSSNHSSSSRTEWLSSRARSTEGRINDRGDT